MFSDEFCELLKTTFLQNTSRRLLLFYGKKYFINIIVKNPLRKGKKWKQLVRKTTTQAKQKLHHYSHQVFVFFYYSKMLLFLFSLLPMIWWKHEFLETMQYHWGLSTIENDFSPSVWKIVFYLYDCNNSINPIQDGLFWGCSRMGGPFCPPPYLKSATHILQWWNLAQLYLTYGRSKNCINHVTHPLSSADISIFSPEINKFCYIKKYTYRLEFDW